MDENMVKSAGTEVVENSTENEKMFTQEQVNEIVRKRLERQKENTINYQEFEVRAAELTARENRLSCREYLIEKGYSADLLDIIDTSDVEKFKEKADKSSKLFGSMYPEVAPLANLEPNYGDKSSAFPKDTKHTPKGYWALDSR